MRLRNDSPTEDASDDDLAHENKWDSGGIINKSRRLHHCALSVISLLRLDESHPTHGSAVPVRDGFEQEQNTHPKTHTAYTFV